MNLTCKDCGHQFEKVFQLPMPIMTWVAQMWATKCPNCGAGHDKLGIGHSGGAIDIPPGHA